MSGTSDDPRAGLHGPSGGVGFSGDAGWRMTVVAARPVGRHAGFPPPPRRTARSRSRTRFATAAPRHSFPAGRPRSDYVERRQDRRETRGLHRPAKARRRPRISRPRACFPGPDL